MKSKSLRYRYNLIGLAIIIFFFLRMALNKFFLATVGQTNLNLWLLCGGVILAVSCFVPTVLIENLSGVHPKLFGKVSKSFTFAISGYCYIIITGISLLNAVLMGLLRKLGIQFTEIQIKPIDNVLTFVLYFLVICILPAIFEEILVRGYILNVFSPYGKRFAIVLSALCFAFMHSQIQHFMPIFACGIMLACIYYYTGSIWPCVALHFANNTVSFLMMYATVSIKGVSALSFGVFINIVIVLWGVYGYIYTKTYHIDIFSVLKGIRKTDRKLITLAKSPVGILAVMVMLLNAFEIFL